MARVIVTIRVMPESPQTDLKHIESEAKNKIEAYKAELGKTEEQPVAFGLKAVIFYVMVDEQQGSTDVLEKELATISGVHSVEVTDVRRTIG